MSSGAPTATFPFSFLQKFFKCPFQLQLTYCCIRSGCTTRGRRLCPLWSDPLRLVLTRRHVQLLPRDHPFRCAGLHILVTVSVTCKSHCLVLSPFHLPPPPVSQPWVCSLCYEVVPVLFVRAFGFLDSAHKRDHMVCVSLGLTYFTWCTVLWPIHTV